MIKKRNDIFFVALVDEFADKVAPASGMRRVEIVKSPAYRKAKIRRDVV